MNTECHEMLLTDLTIDDGVQSRDRIDPVTKGEYQQMLAEGELGECPLPPAVAYYDGKHYWLADGFHRYYAHKDAGILRMPVIVRQGTREDAILFSVGANFDHGLRRTNADKRRAITMLLTNDKWKNRSDRWIAEQCHVSHGLVAQVRADLNPTGKITSREYQRNGQIQQMKVEKDGGEKEVEEIETEEDVEIGNAFPTAEETGNPFDAFNGKIRAAQSSLRQIAEGLKDILEYDKSEKALKSKWANYYSYEGTVGAILALVRVLENGMPAEIVEDHPGYLSKQLSGSRKAVNAA